MDFMVALPTIVRAMAMGAVPILLAALGEVFSERAGMVNIGLEGIMAVGAFVAFAVGKVTGNLWLGLLVGMAAGVLINMIYAFCTVTLCSDQVVTSMAVNILAPAIALFGYNLFVGSNPENATGAQMPNIAIPGLCDLPVIGNGMFNQSLLAYIAFLLVPVVAFFFKRCRAGLSFRSVGEKPQAAETLGINVIRTKYVAVPLPLRAARSSRSATRRFTRTASSLVVASSRWRRSSSAAGVPWASCSRACSLASSMA